MSSEEENYVTVDVQINPWRYQDSIDCCEAVVATVDADGNAGPSLHVGTYDPDSLLVLADAAISELLSAEEEQDALYYDLDARGEIRDMAAELGVDADI